MRALEVENAHERHHMAKGGSLAINVRDPEVRTTRVHGSSGGGQMVV